MRSATPHLVITTPVVRLAGPWSIDPTGSWSFTYVFFSNGTPFDAPNRSDTMPFS